MSCRLPMTGVTLAMARARATTRHMDMCSAAGHGLTLFRPMA